MKWKGAYTFGPRKMMNNINARRESTQRRVSEGYCFGEHSGQYKYQPLV